MTDDEIELHAGLDALALLEFMWLVVRILSIYAAYGLVVSLFCTWASATYGVDPFLEGMRANGSARTSFPAAMPVEVFRFRRGA